MSAILPTVVIDSEPHLNKHFTPYQIHWILAEDSLHAQGKQVYTPPSMKPLSLTGQGFL